MKDFCGHPHVLLLSTKCSDSCYLKFPDGTTYEGYVPTGLGIQEGDEDYLVLRICTQCAEVIGLPPEEEILARAVQLRKEMPQ